MNILNQINSPEDLRRLSINQLSELCAEIRKFLIENLSHNPGHFGSSMGAVEIIVALHYVFNTPRDRIVWDVGHQAYAHKLLTGRRDKFATQRTEGGISGFPFPEESEYDTFVCGHAGNSISAALGMAIADMNTPGEEDRKTIAVVGDASISNGLAFEGLNNASNHPNNLLIILNDNDMSIDDNVGALHHYLSNITTSASYNRLRYKLYTFCKKLGLVNDKRKGLLLRFNNAIKSLISAHQNIFEGLNIRYFGPFDGNDVTKLVKILSDIKNMQGPRILHLRTVKGKGYKVAERNPQAWHAPGNFDPETGEKIKQSSNLLLWQQAFANKLVDLAKENEEIVGITAAMLSGTSMTQMMDAFPKRTFDVGISEGHAVTFAGGLAAAGKKPYVAIYSSFLQRGFDNIIHDVAIQGLPVVFCIDRAGVVGEDGVTHHGLYDIAYLKMIPGLSLCAPMDIESLESLLDISASLSSPMAIRYPRGKAWYAPDNIPAISGHGKGRQIVENSGSDIAILSVGPIGKNAIEAASVLKERGIPTDVYDMVWIKPLDEDLLRNIAKRYKGIITLEDGIRDGGFGSSVCDWFALQKLIIPIIRLGVPDKFIFHASVDRLQKSCGYDVEGIVGATLNLKLSIQDLSKTI